MFRYLTFISISLAFVNGQRLHTSQIALRKLYGLQNEHFDIMKEYLDLESKRLDELKKNLASIHEWWHYKASEMDGYLYTHINAVKLMKQVNYRLGNVESLMNNNKSLEVLTKIDKHKDLSGNHIFLAFKAIRRLQNFYSIPSSDMVNGVYKDRIIGDKMGACDCYIISKYCFEEDDMYGAIDWALQAYNKWHDGDRPYCVDIEILKFYIISSSTYTGLNFSSLLNPNELFNLDDTKYFVKHYFLIKDALFDPLERKALDEFDANSFVHDSELKFIELCKYGRSKRILTKYSKCRYQTKNSSYRILMPFKEEDVYLNPLIKIYHDVLYDSEIEKIITMSLDNLHDARTQSSEGDGRYFLEEKTRSGQLYRIDELHAREHLASLNSRIECISDYSTHTAEKYQVVNYGLGGHYKLHYDAFFGGPVIKTSGNRIATVLFYLTDVENDGYTSFPRLNIISPAEKGAALVWHNLQFNGSLHKESLHGSCPMLKGNKWIMTRWLYEAGQNLLYDWRSE